MMKKEELLARSRAENKLYGTDEREDRELGVAFGLGACISLTVCFLFCIVALVRGEHAFQYGAIMCAYPAGMFWHMFSITKRKNECIPALLCSVLAVVCIVAFFLLG